MNPTERAEQLLSDLLPNYPKVRDRYESEWNHDIELILQAFKEVAQEAFMSNPSYDSIDDFEDYWQSLTQ